MASGAELSCGRQEGGRDGAQAHGKRPSLSLAAGGCGVLRGVRQEQCLYSVQEVEKLPEAAVRLSRSWTSLSRKSSGLLRRVPMGGGKKATKTNQTKQQQQKAKLCLNTLITKVFWHLFFL